MSLLIWIKYHFCFAKVTLIVAPIGRKLTPGIQVAYVGSTANLKCTSKSVPQWRKSDTQHFEYTVIKEHDGIEETIQLNDLKTTDSGIYNCFGKAEQSFKANTELYVGGERKMN